MAKLTYMPVPGDHHHTTVDGITFQAYEPVDVSDDKPELIGKLKKNPWFTDGDVDAERKAFWDRHSKAKASAQSHRAEADKLDREADEQAKAAAVQRAADKAAAVTPSQPEPLAEAAAVDAPVVSDASVAGAGEPAKPKGKGKTKH